MKIFTTALFSVLLLGKKLSWMQYGALMILFVGITLVQFDESSTASSFLLDWEQSVGLAAVAGAAMCSGFSCVYFEKMLKSSSASLWLRNVQLGIFAPGTALIGMLIKDGAEIIERGFFHGYSFLVLTIVVQQAIGGLVVAVVMRYADNILKGFATSVSIILSTVLSVFIFDYSITMVFSLGVAMVMLAIYLYGVSPAAKPEPSSSSLENQNGVHSDKQITATKSDTGSAA